MDLSEVKRLGIDLSSHLLSMPDVALPRAAEEPDMLAQLGLSVSDLDYLDEQTLTAVLWRLKWLHTARPTQIPPNTPWREWLLNIGRGGGKTRTGAEWLGWECWTNPDIRAHVVSPTAADLRITAFEGDSGLVNVIPKELVQTYNRSTNEMILINGSKILGFSAQEPDRLRGPQCHISWADEFAAFGGHLKDPASAAKAARDTIDMLKFGWRLGKHPKLVYTTTPKPVQHVRELIKRAETEPTVVILTRGSTYDNEANLAPTFLEQLAAYEGTTLGRQEIHAELINPEESGIVKRSWFKLYPANQPTPSFEFVLSAWDTAFTDKTSNDPTGNIVLGVFADKETGQFNVLLCDSWTEHMAYPTLKQRVIDEYDNTFGEPGRKADLFLIEDKGSGISIRQDLAGSKIPMWPYNPGRSSKIERLHLVSHLIKLGKVWVPESPKRRGEPRDWCEPFLNVVCSFPLVDHDEEVDCLTMSLSYLQDNGLLQGTARHIDVDEEKDYYREKRKYANPYAQ